MIRRTTLTWFGLALVTGVGLFLLKYEVQRIEETRDALARAIAEERAAIHVLEAEWGYLNEIGRIESLSGRYLDLEPVTAAHLGRIEALPRRDYRPARGPGPLPLADLVLPAAERIPPRPPRRPVR